MNDHLGLWKVTLDIQGNALPFLLEVKNKRAVLYNSSEKHELEYKVKENEIIVELPFDENYLSFDLGNKSGFFVKKKKGEEDKIKLFAQKQKTGTSLFSSTDFHLDGRWKVDFYDNQNNLKKIALGLFEKSKVSSIKGSILTKTGDYRFLEGEGESNRFFLYGFDGQMNFFLNIKVDGDKFEGMIFSGNSWNQKIVGTRDSSFSLENPNTLTKARKNIVDFNAFDLNGDLFEFKKEIKTGRPLIIQVFGSWCPNCLDETLFLNSYMKENNKFDVLAVAFERTENLKKASYLIKRFLKKTNTSYKFVIGSHDKDSKGVLEVLSFLENHLSYPTMIFLDKNHQIKKIHTGFSGPATGIEFVKFKKDFDQTIQSL